MTIAETRLLTPEHRSQLSVFSCAGVNEPWAVEVEAAIRGDIADVLALEDTGYGAAGLWEGDVLVAVNSWDPDRQDPEIWWSSVLAVRLDRRRRGYARRLKTELLERAFDNGIRVVASKVRLENAAMIKLNREFGATVKLEPHDGHHVICTIRVR